MIWKDKILDLYKISVDEEHKFVNMHQDRVKFFAGLLSGLVAGSVAGLFKSEFWYHFAFMSLGPVLIIIACYIAQRGIFRLYQRFLETVTVRAKLEQIMGMTERPKELDEIQNPYWNKEAIIAPRHLESRRRHKTSKEWLQAHYDQGYHLWTVKMFRGGLLLGIALLIVIAFLTYYKY